MTNRTMGHPSHFRRQLDLYVRGKQTNTTVRHPTNKKKTLLKVGGRMPLFLFIFCFHNLQYRHTFNPIHTIHLSVAVRRGLSPSPHRFVSSVGKTVPVVPSRESNSGLPYSKPTRYQLSNAAP